MSHTGAKRSLIISQSICVSTHVPCAFIIGLCVFKTRTILTPILYHLPPQILPEILSVVSISEIRIQ